MMCLAEVTSAEYTFVSRFAPLCPLNGGTYFIDSSF